TAIEVAVAHLGLVRVARPAVARLGRHHVDVAVEEEALAAAGAREPGRQLRPALEAEPGRHLPRAGDVGRRGLPQVHRRAGGPEPVAEIVLQARLLAGRV